MSNFSGLFKRGAVVIAALATLATACTTPPVPGPGGFTGEYFQFRGTEVSVVNHNDSFIYGNTDEPYLINIAFSVKLGVPGSAEVSVGGSRSNARSNMGDGSSATLTGGQQAAVNFNAVDTLDVLDLADPNRHLEIHGVWSWAMEKDDVSVGQFVTDTADFLEDALVAITNLQNIPSDPNALINLVLDVVFEDFFNTLGVGLGALFQSIPGVTDDALASRMYVGIGSTGAFSTIVDNAIAGSLPIDPIVIPVVTLPPDILGVSLFSLGHNNTFNNQVMNGDGRHDYNLEMVNVGQPNVAPNAVVTASTQSGPSPLQVNFDASQSADVDGTIVSYNWDFGDFTSGQGTQVSHTFTNGGSYIVELEVVDNKGASNRFNVPISVTGGPTSAPTGLSKLASGCCNTWGEFNWSPVVGADAYEINMDAYFGGGCLVDASAVVLGQRDSGRVTSGTLCLGSKYDVKVRARANGIWGPWSPTTRFTL